MNKTYPLTLTMNCRMFLLHALVLLAIPLPGAETMLYVHPDGFGNGTGPAPVDAFGSLEEAAAEVRNLNGNMSDDIIVYIRGGEYQLNQTFTLTEADSGQNGYRVIYRAYPNETPVVHGAVVLNDWSLSTRGGIPLWRAELPSQSMPDGLRGLFVDGQRRTRARSDWFAPIGWSGDGTGYWKLDGLRIKGTEMANWSNPLDIEIHQQLNWRWFVLAVEGIEVDTEANATDVLTSDQPALLSPSDVAFQGAHAIRLENAFELISQPGDWYYDRSEGAVYYWPLPGETLTGFQAYAPKLERLLLVQGDGGIPAKNITFDGITFAYAAWNGANDDGWYGYGAGNISRGSGRLNGITFANIFFEQTEAIMLINNRFKHLGGTGVHFSEGQNDILIEGNIFYDISANGLALGATQNVIQPGSNITVRNNLFYKTGAEYRMTAATLSGPLLNFLFEHNDIRDVPYDGLKIKTYANQNTMLSNFSWGNWVIRHNRIENSMAETYDGGAIYTWRKSSSDGSRSEIYQNYIYATLSKSGYAIYLDNDSEHWNVHENVIDYGLSSWALVKGGDHDVTDNVFRNAEPIKYISLFGSNPTDAGILDANNTAVTSFNAAQQAIVANAGLENGYIHLLSEVSFPPNNNTPPVFDLGDYATTLGLNDRLILHPAVGDDKAPFEILFRDWKQLSGLGDVNFFGVQEAADLIQAAFSEPGTYDLQFSLSDGDFTTQETITVNVIAEDIGTELTETLPASAYTASNSYSATTTPNFAFDNDISTYWWAGQGGGWLQVDLGQPEVLSRIQLTLRSGFSEFNRRQFELIASDDPDFNTFTALGGQGDNEFLALDNELVWTLPLKDNTSSYRYVRFLKRPQYGGTLPEMKIWRHEFVEQVPSGLISISDAVASGGGDPLNSLDGDANSQYFTATIGEIITYELEATVNLDYIQVLFPKVNGRTYFFELQLSLDEVGENFITLFDGGVPASNSFEKIYLNGASARRFRLIAKGNSDNTYFQLKELEAYASGDSSPQSIVEIELLNPFSTGGGDPLLSIDGDIFTQYNASNYGDTITYELAESTELSSLEFWFPNVNGRNYFLEVLVSQDSTGESFTSLFDGSLAASGGFEPVALSGYAKRIRVITKANSDNGFFQLKEVRLFGLDETQAGPAYQEIVPVSATSPYNGNPSRSIDEDFSSHWFTSGSGKFIEFDLGDSYILTALKLAMVNSSGRIYFFKAYVSPDATGDTFYPVHDGTTLSSGIPATGSFSQVMLEPEITARRIRVVGEGNTSTNDYFHLAEFRALVE